MWYTSEENSQWSSQSPSQTVLFASIHKCSWLPPATLRLPFLSPPRLPPPFLMSANNKDQDEVTVRGNVYHEIGCVIFRICDASRSKGYQCNPSHQEFRLTAKRLFRQERSVDLEQVAVLDNGAVQRSHSTNKPSPLCFSLNFQSTNTLKKCLFHFSDCYSMNLPLRVDTLKYRNRLFYIEGHDEIMGHA